MKENKKKTFQIGWNNEMKKMEIHLDSVGLSDFIQLLKDLDKSQPPEHLHLMSPSWGGNTLTEEIEDKDIEIVHHLQIYKW